MRQWSRDNRGSGANATRDGVKRAVPTDMMYWDEWNHIDATAGIYGGLDGMEWVGLPEPGNIREHPGTSGEHLGNIRGMFDVSGDLDIDRATLPLGLYILLSRLLLSVSIPDWSTFLIQPDTGTQTNNIV